MLVVLLLLALESYVGNDTLEPVVQVIDPAVVPVYVVPPLFFIVPLPLFLFKLIVFVFAVAHPVNVPVVVPAVPVAVKLLEPPLLYPAAHVTV